MGSKPKTAPKPDYQKMEKEREVKQKKEEKKARDAAAKRQGFAAMVNPRSGFLGTERNSKSLA